MNRASGILTFVLTGLLCPEGLHAQEMITPLFGNPPDLETCTEEAQLKSAAATSLLLPFFEDFSDYSGRPDTSLWTDASAFVNNSFPVNPVTNGVATLDGVDRDGSIYPHAVLSPSTYEADMLTSKPIQLEYPSSDSLYFSFFYQAGGRGDVPESQDSLLLDFYDVSLEEWIPIWGIPGDSVHPFRQVMIPVTGAGFLNNGFRFRFRNLVSLPGNRDYPDKRSNVDFWNLDYIRLDRGRFAADTVLRDVAFRSPLPPMLKDLSAIPWSQFAPAYNTVLRPSLRASYLNNDTIPRNVTRSLTILEPYYDQSYSPGTPTAQDIPPQADTMVNFGYIYPVEFDRGDSALLRFKASLRTDEFDPKVNDTVVHDQLFKDYWAYDDGTAEAGYGLRGQGTRNGRVGVLYRAYQPDLLGGVDICFNHVYDSLNLDYYFKLMVWEGSGGTPGRILHEDEKDHTPEYLPGRNSFRRYHFSSPVPVDGPFFVGWIQYNEYILNVGLDLNRDEVPPVLFYNFNGTWNGSLAPGVIMLRPFLYREPTGKGSYERPADALGIYPNPASRFIRLQIPGPDSQGKDFSDRPWIRIYELSGRLAGQIRYIPGKVDVSHLQEGIYLIRVVYRETLYHGKLLIQR